MPIVKRSFEPLLRPTSSHANALTSEDAVPHVVFAYVAKLLELAGLISKGSPNASSVERARRAYQRSKNH